MNHERESKLKTNGEGQSRVPSTSWKTSRQKLDLIHLFFNLIHLKYRVTNWIWICIGSFQLLHSKTKTDFPFLFNLKVNLLVGNVNIFTVSFYNSNSGFKIAIQLTVCDIIHHSSYKPFFYNFYKFRNIILRLKNYMVVLGGTTASTVLLFSMMTLQMISSWNNLQLAVATWTG